MLGIFLLPLLLVSGDAQCTLFTEPNFGGMSLRLCRLGFCRIERSQDPRIRRRRFNSQGIAFNEEMTAFNSTISSIQVLKMEMIRKLQLDESAFIEKS